MLNRFPNGNEEFLTDTEILWRRNGIKKDAMPATGTRKVFRLKFQKKKLKETAGGRIK